MTNQATKGTGAIPADWCKAVCAALAEGNERITMPDSAWRLWQSAFPDTFKYQLYAVLEETLDGGTVKGRRVDWLHPAGEGYEFFFEFEGRTVYGKINLLTPERRIILILSAHIPRKGDTL